jgi:hypothetical protein
MKLLINAIIGLAIFYIFFCLPGQRRLEKEAAYRKQTDVWLQQFLKDVPRSTRDIFDVPQKSIERVPYSKEEMASWSVSKGAISEAEIDASVLRRKVSDLQSEVDSLQSKVSDLEK